jgi:hypothetical protein
MYGMIRQEEFTLLGILFNSGKVSKDGEPRNRRTQKKRRMEGSTLAPVELPTEGKVSKGVFPSMTGSRRGAVASM